jgi:hypothetical protein
MDGDATRCPECGYQFTIDELRAVRRDPSLRPGGKGLVRSLVEGVGWGVALIVALAVVFGALFVVWLLVMHFFSGRG